FRNVESLKPLTAFNFTKSAVSTSNISEDEKRMEQEHKMSQCELEEDTNDDEGEKAVEEDSYGSESPVNIRALLERIEVRLLSKNKMPADEVLQFTVLKRYFTDQLNGIGKMKASMNAAVYTFDKGEYMARVIRGWGKLYELSESLPPLSKRGKHTKWRSELDDEDVREQCLVYFRSLSPNARTATKLKAQ
ncbi:hypothetical protein V1509DRAFT_669940, partial [Lipomyces kononenkoae]